jgi:hypothetical protein
MENNQKNGNTILDIKRLIIGIALGTIIIVAAILFF